MMISVITPVFNGEEFIEFCIQNVIEQNCPFLEHIIVDGGSTDRTVEIINKYANQYQHIRWISEKDRGQSDAMNKGISMARGEIIGVLNDDDFYEPNVLNRILEIFKNLPNPSFIVGNCNIWGDEGQLMRVNRPKHLSLIGLVSRVNHFPMNPSAYFYHRSLHEQIGFYDINDHYTMDLDFILRAIQSAHVKYIDQIWGNFRYIQGTKTVSSQQDSQGSDRVGLLLRKHREKLPILQRWQAELGENFLYRILYFSEYPQDFLPAIQRKLKRIVQL